MPRSYLIVYLVYGFVYILMGLIAISGSRTDKKFPFYNNLQYIGAFGILHGLSELITVIVISDLFLDVASFLFIVKRVLKALSFIFLFKFGLCFYIDSRKSIKYKAPEFIFLVWFVALIYLLQTSIDVRQLSMFFNISIRYFMAFPMGVFVFYTIYRVKDNYQEIKGLNTILRYLAFIFLLYSIVDGLFVRQANYFPANILNNSFFMSVFLIPIQYIKILIGVIICYLLIKANLRLRSYESAELVDYQKEIAIQSERSRLHSMIHDKTIQKLFSSGLLLESIQKQKNEEESELIDLAISQMNECIDDLRETIYEEPLHSEKTLKQLTESLITEWQVVSSMSLSCTYNLSTKTEELIDDFQKNHCMWIIQEMLVNSIKHAKGSFCKVEISEKNGSLYIKTYDNGIGFKTISLDTVKGHGLTSIHERIEQLNGKFKIDSKDENTVVWVSFPINGGT